MKQFKFEKRELRSFRIYKGILDLKKIFINNNIKPVIFTMSDAFQPVDRADFRENWKAQGLKISYISKKIINLWTQNREWAVLRELLRGNIIKIEYNNTTTNLNLIDLNQQTLQYILLKDLFSIRLLINNKNLYRQNKIKEYMNKISENTNFKHNLVKEDIKISLDSSSIILNLSLLKSNYN